MKNTTYGERLNQVLKEQGVSAYKMSLATELPQSSISNYRKDKSIPNTITNNVIASYLNINSKWLLSGEGKKEDVLKNDNELIGDSGSIDVVQPYTIDVHQNKNANKFIKLPNGQYMMTMPLAEHNIQAGFLDHFQDLDYLADMAQHSIIVDKPVQGRYIAFRVKGDSMDDGTSEAIVQNSIVSSRELNRQHWSSKLRTKDFPYWVIYTTQSKYPLLKEITGHNVEEGIIKCHSLNDGPDYSDFELSINDIQALFYVVDVSKSISRKLTY